MGETKIDFLVQRKIGGVWYAVRDSMPFAVGTLTRVYPFTMLLWAGVGALVTFV